MKSALPAPKIELSDDLLSAFRFRFRNWDAMSVNHPPFLTEPFCLSRKDHEFLVKSVERLHPLMIRARQRMAGDSGSMRCLGLDAWTQEMILKEQASVGGEAGLEIARYDFFKTTAGRWMISEINNDVPSGFNESSFMNEIALKAWGDAGKYEFPAAVTDAFVAALKQKNIRSLAMLYGTAYSEDLQICLFLKERLEGPALEVTLASPSHLKVFPAKAAVWGREVDAIYRIYPVEWFSALPNRDEWAKLPRLKKMLLVNPLSTILSQSKNFFSFLCAEKDGLFTPEDWASIQPFIPHTEPFSAEKVPGCLEEKDRWVMKPVFGRMGYDVFVGKLLTPEAWRKALSEASKGPAQYCLQECFEIAPEAFSVGDCYLCVGVFVIYGRFAGYFTRASLTPITTYEAMDVATLVELS